MQKLFKTLMFLSTCAALEGHATVAVSQPQGAPLLSPMHIAEDGRGQVLIFPYYTIRNNHDSSITLTNHTDQVKALKLRFLESRNGRDVLNFNLYLGPMDSWTGSLISASSSINGFDGQESLKIVTTDDSCTVPAINDQQFLPYAFSSAFDDGLIQNMSRATEGMLQVFEMGQVTGDDAQAAINSADCGRLVSNWTPPTGQWIVDGSVNVIEPEGQGGISGTMDIIEVSSGSAYAYDAVAISEFTDQGFHSFPGDLFPDLSSGDNTRAQVNEHILTWDNSVNAVSALFMQTHALNEFDISGSSQTEWINAYPTKAFYVDALWSIAPVPVAPFYQETVSTFGSCEDHRFKAFDQDDNVNAVSDSPVIPDPLPENYSNRPQDCWAVNVSDVNQDIDSNTILDAQSKIVDFNTDEVYTSISDLPFSTGILQRDYDEEIIGESRLIGRDENDELQILYGKPVVGFAVQEAGMNTSLKMNEVVTRINSDMIFMNNF